MFDNPYTNSHWPPRNELRTVVGHSIVQSGAALGTRGGALFAYTRVCQGRIEDNIVAAERREHLTGCSKFEM